MIPRHDDAADVGSEKSDGAQGVRNRLVKWPTFSRGIGKRGRAFAAFVGTTSVLGFSCSSKTEGPVAEVTHLELVPAAEWNQGENESATVVARFSFEPGNPRGWRTRDGPAAVTPEGHLSVAPGPTKQTLIRRDLAFDAAEVSHQLRPRGWGSSFARVE